jgi:NAD-dependent SIR2 family protein deacetylase
VVDRTALERAAVAVATADVVVVTAGAGLGVDAGLPDFRSPDGFWAAYPPYRGLGVGFHDLANPGAFAMDPRLAWGFYAHRRRLYAEAEPHRGHEVLAEWVRWAPHAGLAITSNVDGLLQRAEVGPVWEVHGTIALDQCTVPCGSETWTPQVLPEVAPSTMRALGELPTCPHCGALARPNILLFGGDAAWSDGPSQAQHDEVEELLDAVVGDEVVVVEVGAGTAVPTIRRAGAALQRSHGATLVRVNPDEPEGDGALPLRGGAAEVLEALAEAVDRV